MLTEPILRLALPTPLRQLFDYLPPEDAGVEASALQPGIRVEVPFAGQTLVGILLECPSVSALPIEKLRRATRLVDAEPLLPTAVLQLCLWCADYYQHPVGEVIQAALPPGLRDGKQVGTTEWVWSHTAEGLGLPASALARAPKQQLAHQLLLEHQRLSAEQLRSQGVTTATLRAMQEKGLVEQKPAPPATAVNPPAELLREPHLTLNPHQADALQAVRYHEFACYLLDGATGSGKTEVYLQAMGRVLNAGRQILVLVPEIGLAPQTLARIRQRFAVPLAELHSQVSEAARARHWQAAAQGRARIVVGTRLSVFTPLPELGLIIVDEEHDLSFKQQEGLRYSARDLAIVRAKHSNVPVILGSATPALESLHNAREGRYRSLRLPERAGKAQLPTPRVVNLRDAPMRAGVATESLAAIQATLAAGHQVLVFLNRRGYAPVLLCHQCGWTAECRHCDSRLTLHQSPYHLRCHHCDTRRPVPQRCPQCQGQQLLDHGQGTEKMEVVLGAAFPEVPLFRVDRDTMARKGAMTELMAEVSRGKPALLIGTQILAKGHHFPAVALVVILDADQGLMSPDFRAAERLGQLITQVAGRAGRGDHAGEVLIQTHQPEHPLLQCLVQHGYHAFAEQLLAARYRAQLPPYRAMAVLRAESKRGENAVEFLQMARKLADSIRPAGPDMTYLGPIPALMERRNGRFRFQLQIIGRTRSILGQTLDQLIANLDKQALSKRTRWSIDVDPLDLS